MKSQTLAVFAADCYFCGKSVVVPLTVQLNALGDEIIKADCLRCLHPLVKIISNAPDEEWGETERNWQGVSYTSGENLPNNILNGNLLCKMP